MDKVSIIIPLYNNEDNMPLLLERVCNQTYPNIEIILIDDGSVDDTYKICENYEKNDGRILLFTQSNHGVSATRNIGIEKATGKYVTFIDGDDNIEYEYIEKLVKAISGKGVEAISVASISVIGTHGKKIIPNITEYKTSVDYFLNHWNVWGILISKELISTIKFDEKVKISEDYKFISQIVANNEIKAYAASEAVYNYVIHEGSSMQSRYSIAFLNGLKAEVEAYEYLLKSGRKDFESSLIGNGSYQFMKRFFDENATLRKEFHEDYIKAKKIIFKYLKVIMFRNTIERRKKIMILVSCIFPWILVIKNKIRKM